MSKVLWKLFKQEEGATALEYAILVVLVAIVLSGGALLFGTSMSGLFSKQGSAVDAWGPGALTKAP